VVEYGGDTLSRYDVSFAPGETKLMSATDPRLFPTKHHPRQLKLFALDKALVESEWLKALGLEAVRTAVAGEARDAAGSAVLLPSSSLEAPHRVLLMR
jgi:hypothetical protein